MAEDKKKKKKLTERYTIDEILEHIRENMPKDAEGAFKQYGEFIKDSNQDHIKANIFEAKFMGDDSLGVKGAYNNAVGTLHKEFGKDGTKKVDDEKKLKKVLIDYMKGFFGEEHNETIKDMEEKCGGDLDEIYNTLAYQFDEHVDPRLLGREVSSMTDMAKKIAADSNMTVDKLKSKLRLNAFHHAQAAHGTLTNKARSSYMGLMPLGKYAAMVESELDKEGFKFKNKTSFGEFMRDPGRQGSLHEQLINKTYDEGKLKEYGIIKKPVEKKS